MAAPAEKEEPVNTFDSSISLAGLFSGERKKPTLILLLTPLFLTAFKYYGSKQYYLDNLQSITIGGDPDLSGALYVFISSLLFLGLPSVLLIKVVFKESFSSYGVQVGDWRFGWKAFLVLAPIMILSTFPSSRMNDFLAEYPLYRGAGGSAGIFLFHALSYLVYYVGWEIFFRGFVQHGLRGALGDWNAILVQTLASCLVHIGKPAGETFSSILGGIVWGIVVFRSRSLWPVLLVHWLLGVSLDFFILFT